MSALDYMQKVLDDVPRYTQADLDRAIAQARKDALEEAAKLVRSRAGTFDDLPKDVLPARRVENDMGTCLRLAGAIRALQVADAGTEGTT